ncbi:RHS repeat-associated core domain protein [Leptospira interrogans str. FPW2026]|nr:RHS repeat-associated core domain protein [Leptospira interrogans str. FPW2026]
MILCGSVQDVWSYQYTNHQVTNVDSPKSGADALVMQYDANGNLTRQRDNVKDLTKRISIDSQDRITQIQDGNNAILGSYWYDESGFRIRKSSLEPKNNVFSNVEILYPSKFFGLEFIESENVISSVNNVYLNGVRIAALNEAGALAYYLTDQVDSVSTVLDDEGNTLSLMQYLPYGETFVQRGDLNFSPKFNSQELDRESGFYFFNARFYDPGIARFTSADSVIDGEFDTQGWNRFSYVKGNPIGAKDPTGHFVPAVIAGVALAIGFATEFEELEAPGKNQRNKNQEGQSPKDKLKDKAIDAASDKIGDTVAKGLKKAAAKCPGAKAKFACQVAAEVVGVAIGSGGSSSGKINKTPKTKVKGDRPENYTPEGFGRRGAFREAKRNSGIPVSQQPKTTPAKDKRGNKIPGRDYDFGDGKVIRDHSGGHKYPDNPNQNRGPHINDTSGNHYDY